MAMHPNFTFTAASRRAIMGIQEELRPASGDARSGAKTDPRRDAQEV